MCCIEGIDGSSVKYVAPTDDIPQSSLDHESQRILVRENELIFVTRSGAKRFRVIILLLYFHYKNSRRFHNVSEIVDT